MPACVLIKNTNRILVLKSSWCNGVKNDARNLTSGNHPADETKIFFSPDRRAIANFSKRIEKVFDDTKTACYIGHILNVCGKY